MAEVRTLGGSEAREKLPNPRIPELPNQVHWMSALQASRTAEPPKPPNLASIDPAGQGGGFRP
ncbi:MAG TPA: hypothetical protein PLO61_09695, partial [Fimbriimonadaceae bacterium]|nr:hypothetical protein [Fimbriimonadaceae bacterium]